MPLPTLISISGPIVPGAFDLTIEGSFLGVFPETGALFIYENENQTGTVDELSIGGGNDLQLTGVSVPGTLNNSSGTRYLFYQRGNDLAWSFPLAFVLSNPGVAVDHGGTVWQEGVCRAFLASLLEPMNGNKNNLHSDTLKFALYYEDALLDRYLVTHYTSVGEVVGAGYNSGGFTLPAWDVSTFNFEPCRHGYTSPLVFGPMTISGIRGGLIYNTESANRAIAVLDFGKELTLANQSLRLTDLESRLIRISG
jgi:hypothetical protein